MAENTVPKDQAELETLLGGTNGVTTKVLEPWLWDAACSIRGAMDAPKYRDYILPLIFLKRLSDVYDDEVTALAEKFGDTERARKMTSADHQLVRIFLPEECRWESVRQLREHVGEELTKAFRRLARENPPLAGVVDVVDFNAAVNGQRIIDDERLRKLIEVLSRHRLGLRDVEPDVLGRAYEYLLRKFAENQGQSAGEFFTPKEVGWLVAELIDPQPGETAHDPAAGSSGLLIKAELLRAHRHGNGSNPLKLYAQERLSTTYALSRMNLFIHDLDGEVELDDTLRHPKFGNGTRLKQFDFVVANPMWNQSDYDAAFYEADRFNRFTAGQPPSNTADLAWVQHIVASMAPSGRAAVVLDTNAVNRGSGASGKNRERDIRRKLVEEDLVDGVILLPENLFYNTGAPGVVVVLRKNKPAERKGKVVLVNASQEYVKGQPKNFLTLSSVAAIAGAFHRAEDVDGLVRVMTVDELKDVDFDLSPNRHVVPPVRQRDSTMGEARETLQRAEAAHGTASNLRRDLAGEYRPNDAARLDATSKLGPIPGDWKLVPLQTAIADQFSGDYGEGAPAEGLTLCRVVKATNFPAVAAGRLDGLVERFVRDSAIARKRLQEGDFIVETSGGGKYQATGRVLYVTDEIASADPPIHPTNFTRVLRLDRERFAPRFVYHYWRLLYGLGRTQPYERQPTQIRNFKITNFLANESIPDLDPGEQAGLARVLDAIEGEEVALQQRVAALEALRDTALFDVLTGQYVPSADG